MAMEFELKAYYFIVCDNFNNTWDVVYEDPNDTVQICGLKDKAGEPICFESEALHLLGWIRKYDLRYKEGSFISHVVRTDWDD